MIFWSWGWSFDDKKKHVPVSNGLHTKAKCWRNELRKSPDVLKIKNISNLYQISSSSSPPSEQLITSSLADHRHQKHLRCAPFFKLLLLRLSETNVYAGIIHSQIRSVFCPLSLSIVLRKALTCLPSAWEPTEQNPGTGKILEQVRL